MVRNIAKVASLMGLLSACADPVSMRYTLHLSPRFPSDYADDVLVAAHRWEDKTGVKIDVVVEAVDCNSLDSQFNICVHPSDEAYVQSRLEGAAAVTITYPLGSNANVYVAMDMPILKKYYSDTTGAHVELFRGTVTHEIGHAMGLEHSPNPNDLMYYKMKINHNTRITCDDVTQFSNYRGIRIPCVEGAWTVPGK